MALLISVKASTNESDGSIDLPVVIPGGLTNSAIVLLTSAQDSNHANLPVTVANWNTSENFTKIRHDEASGNNRTEAWILLNPTAGSFNIHVESSGGIGEFAIFAFVLDHAYQSTTVDGNNGTNGSAQNPSVAVTQTTPYSMIFSVLSTEATITSVNGAGQTIYGPLTDQSFENAAASYEGPNATPGSDTQGFNTSSGQSYAITAVVIAPDAQPPQPQVRASELNGGVLIRPAAFMPGRAR